MKDVCQGCDWRAPDTCRVCHQESDTTTATVMTVWCMECGHFIRENDGKGQVGESHGLCADCLEAWMAR